MQSLIGYHGTFADCVNDIFNNGFKATIRSDHWLGQGIYFYKDDEGQARVWAHNKRKRHYKYSGKSIAIIKALILVNTKELLNLTLREGFDKLTLFASDFLENPDNRLQFKVEDKDKNRSLLIDYMCKEKGYKVVLCAFPHSPPKFKRIEEDINAGFGLYLCEQQICTKDMETIKNIECVYQEDSRYHKAKFSIDIDIDKER